MAYRHTQWLGIGFDAWLTTLEAMSVIWLRSWALALGGPAADREARRMVDEKLAANAAFGWLLMTGGAGRSPEAAARKALRHYGGRVRANQRRLTR